MDRDLLRQCLAYHGEPLLNKLKCEQTENPDFQAVVSDLSKATYERYVDQRFSKREQAPPCIHQRTRSSYSHSPPPPFPMLQYKYLVQILKLWPFFLDGNQCFCIS